MNTYIKTIIISLISINTVFSQINSIDSCKISYSQLFEETINLDDKGDIKQAANCLKTFLYNRDSTFLIANEGKDLEKFIYDELFPIDANQIEYHILNVGIVKKGFIFSILIRQDLSNFDAYKNMIYVLGIYRAVIIKTKDGYKLDCSLQTEDFKVKKSKFGTYIYQENRTNKKEINLEKYNEFSKNFIKIFKIDQPKEKLKYVISDRNDAFKIFGFSYSNSTTGMYFRKLNLLINITNTELDKHELTHFYLNKFNLGKFLSEGIAVYLGGSNGDSFKSFIKKEINNFKSVGISEQTNWLNLFKEGKLQGGPYIPFYYALSGLLIEDFIEKNGPIKLKELFISNPQILPKEFITKHIVLEKINLDVYLKSLIEQE
jgi:hypothetical protein